MDGVRVGGLTLAALQVADRAGTEASPLGQGLLGKKIGETAEIPAPKGSYELEIVAIKFDYLEGEG